MVTEKADLERLLERVEAGTGSRWDINIDLALALGWTRLQPPADADRPFTSLWVNPDGAVHGSLPPDWAGSLDATVGLISTDLSDGERWSISIDSRLQNQPWACYIEDEWAANRNGLGNGATRALALCAAYLRAKLALQHPVTSGCGHAQPDGAACDGLALPQKDSA